MVERIMLGGRNFGEEKMIHGTIPMCLSLLHTPDWMHRTVEQLGGRAGRDPFSLSNLNCGGAWSPCHSRPWLPGGR